MRRLHADHNYPGRYTTYDGLGGLAAAGYLEVSTPDILGRSAVFFVANQERVPPEPSLDYKAAYKRLRSRVIESKAYPMDDGSIFPPVTIGEFLDNAVNEAERLLHGTDDAAPSV